MAKVKTAFYCQSCGARASKWVGQCPSCTEWNTLVEEVIQKDSTSTKTWESSTNGHSRTAKPTSISKIRFSDNSRVITKDKELNRVLGGGIVPGSVVLFGGEPGIGKSTLMIQLSILLNNQLKILYVTGEESEQQIKMRAERIGANGAENCYILTETNTQNIFQQIKELEPQLVIIDSIQTLHTTYIESAAGSISQVRQCTAELTKYAKDTNTPVFLIGHINKEGNIAGPKVLEHIVDTVLQFEGDQHNNYRILRTTKNRYGSTSELGIYEMSDKGLREVTNPSEILINQRDVDFSGIAIAATMEGMRPMLIEVQALVSNAAYGTPQRSSTGFDLRRLSMLLAVLEKKCGFKLASQDVFLNIAGGIKVIDPSIDLAVVCAILASYEDLIIPTNACFAGEVGLTGEIRAVNRVEQRISEAEKLGFEQVFISKYHKKGIDQKRFKIELKFVGKVDEVFSLLFG
ncbi:MAG: DNA repair protein RadA [Bacteroidia bacterium]|nr:DNA repair protein RadA [Bacteroidia bacterium]